MSDVVESFAADHLSDILALRSNSSGNWNCETNEASMGAHLLLPMLSSLGWANGKQEIILENWTPSKGRIDYYAARENLPIELKRPSYRLTPGNLDAICQLRQYMRSMKAPHGLLVNGHEWIRLELNRTSPNLLHAARFDFLPTMQRRSFRGKTAEERLAPVFDLERLERFFFMFSRNSFSPSSNSGSVLLPVKEARHISLSGKNSNDQDVVLFHSISNASPSMKKFKALSSHYVGENKFL
jgi:hypothetical protein